MIILFKLTLAALFVEGAHHFFVFLYLLEICLEAGALQLLHAIHIVLHIQTLSIVQLFELFESCI